MLGFGEKYSREGYDETQEKERLAKKEAEEHPGKFKPILPISGIKWDNRERTQYTYRQSRHENRHERAVQRLEQLKEIAHGEAVALEKEHERLTATIMEAQRALADFERDKLGMKDKEDTTEVGGVETKE